MISRFSVFQFFQWPVATKREFLACWCVTDLSPNDTKTEKLKIRKFKKIYSGGAPPNKFF